jgi:hypothetical protein
MAALPGTVAADQRAVLGIRRHGWWTLERERRLVADAEAERDRRRKLKAISDQPSALSQSGT